MPKQFLTTPDATFLNLQSGNARPYFYIEAIISGITSIIADSYTSTNWLIDGGIIDREKPAFPGDRSNIFSSDVTLKVDNSTRRFSPVLASSVFFGNDYLESPFNYWAGFVNVSDTALLVQRGAFILESLRVDGRENIAYMRLRDKFKKSLERKIGLNDISGTSIPFVASGVIDGNLVLQSLFITGSSLTAGDLSLATAGISFDNISFNNLNIAEAASLIAEASDGYLFTNRRGVLTFNSNSPVFTTASAAFSILESYHAQRIFYEQTKDDRLSKVVVEFLSGTSVSVAAETTATAGNNIIISNDAIQGTAEALAIAGRTLDRFSGQVTRLEIPSVWMPSLDIGDIVTITSDNHGLSGTGLFEIYKIQDEPTNNQMRLFLINKSDSKSKDGNKFSFFTDASAVNCGTIFTGGVGEANGWQSFYGYFCRETTTAVNPGFDLEGNNNNVINTGVTSSGAGGTGIEVPFLFY